jgi:hypothetical protein
MRLVMNAILAWLALSALMGLFFGRYFSWIAVLAAGTILAILSAATLQSKGLAFFPGVPAPPGR